MCKPEEIVEAMASSARIILGSLRAVGSCGSGHCKSLQHAHTLVQQLVQLPTNMCELRPGEDYREK